MDMKKIDKEMKTILSNMEKNISELQKINPMVDGLLEQYGNNPLMKQLNEIKNDVYGDMKSGKDLNVHINKLQDFLKMIDKDANNK